jgi:hypothetical protein
VHSEGETIEPLADDGYKWIEGDVVMRQMISENKDEGDRNEATMLTSLHDRLFRRWARLLLQALRYCIRSLPQHDRFRLESALERLASAGKCEIVPEFRFVSTPGGGVRLQRTPPLK